MSTMIVGTTMITINHDQEEWMKDNRLNLFGFVPNKLGGSIDEGE